MEPGAGVLIAMSGGVDSSVAAYLLSEQGRHCAGATMRLYRNEDIGLPRFHSCCAQQDIEDAAEVAFQLDIPHRVLDLTAEFREQVIQRFVQGYERGDTPNPCIDCNRYLKFDRLLHIARQEGLVYLATGHYARIVYDRSTGRYLLKKAADTHKDQSYVLYRMTQEQLAHTQFPLGELQKEQVRALAERLGFVNARKHDSQDICFVPDGDYAHFLEQYTGIRYPDGDLLDQAGRTVGRHHGAVRYTLGQRRGLGLAMGAPVYVCGKCMRCNTVTVGPESALYARGLLAEDMNWIIDPPSVPFRVQAKIRYRQAEQWATVTAASETWARLEFDTPQRAVTPGQSAVLYRGDLVLGGGTIREAISL